MTKSTCLATLAATTFTLGCATYTRPVPQNFTTGQTLAVSGATGFKLNQMTVGDYSVQIDRSSTREQRDGDVVRERDKRQGYSFVIKRNDATVFTGGCNLTSSGRRVAGPGGFEINAGESSALECEMLPKGTGRDSWRLELHGKPRGPLSGNLSGGSSNFTIEGSGTAFGSTKHGPTGGYYIRQGERTLASVQVVGKRNVTFAAEAQSDALLAAAVALLLVDESVLDPDR
jgi:hypothetical protein